MWIHPYLNELYILTILTLSRCLFTTYQKCYTIMKAIAERINFWFYEYSIAVLRSPTSVKLYTKHNKPSVCGATLIFWIEIKISRHKRLWGNSRKWTEQKTPLNEVLQLKLNYYLRLLNLVANLWIHYYHICLLSHPKPNINNCETFQLNHSFLPNLRILL